MQKFASRLEEIYGGVVQDVISRASNLGSDNPYKGPTARSLFYEAASRNPNKYGQFLFYSLGNNDNNFIDAYYRSESQDYNRNVSSVKSKNPSAGFLVRETVDLESIYAISSIGNLPGLTSSFERSIIGGLSAPYHWKDFLYCKYYGTIPNNYMITLRRFPSPVLDNLSVPSAIKNSEAYIKNGAGRPVAQAVTWFGANTDNSLNSLLTFSTGMNWEPKPQEEILRQMENTKGFTNDAPFKLLTDIAGVISPTGSEVIKTAASVANSAAVALDPQNETVDAMRTFGIRDFAKDRAGVMGEYIWTSVDTINSTYVRGRGLTFDWKAINVTFEYELASLGEVNTKAAMLDILGNLLAIGTNYGTFLTPNFRYDSEFPSIGFPGGDTGLESFYRDPLGWLLDNGNKISDITSKREDPTQGTPTGEVVSNSSGAENQGQFQKVAADLTKLITEKNITRESINALESKYGVNLSKLLKGAFTQDFIASWQMPVSFLTGAPIGEWHLVIGNPCNPIAMIGNLICKDVKISFGEQLGPDDFPTSIKAVFTLDHARHRERGEIESIFNRGDGRFYQSSMPTSSNAQSFGAFADITGKIMSQDRIDQILGMDSFFGSANDMKSPGAQNNVDQNGIPNFGDLD
jgi:hypothetical protein